MQTFFSITTTILYGSRSNIFLNKIPLYFFHLLILQAQSEFLFCFQCYFSIINCLKYQKFYCFIYFTDSSLNDWKNYDSIYGEWMTEVWKIKCSLLDIYWWFCYYFFLKLVMINKYSKVEAPFFWLPMCEMVVVYNSPVSAVSISAVPGLVRF